MDWIRKRNLIVRWSILSALSIAIFWGIWYLIAGKIPVTSEITIKLTYAWSLTLENTIPRWVDILIGPIWTTAIVLIFTSERIQKIERSPGVLIASLVTTLFLCSMFLLIVISTEDWNLGPLIFVIFIFCLLHGSIDDDPFEEDFFVIFTSIFTLFFSLIIALYYGLIYGLIVALVYSSTAILGVGLGAGLLINLLASLKYLIKHLNREDLKNLGSTISKWLVANDKK